MSDKPKTYEDGVRECVKLGRAFLADMVRTQRDPDVLNIYADILLRQERKMLRLVEGRTWFELGGQAWRESVEPKDETE